MILPMVQYSSVLVWMMKGPPQSGWISHSAWPGLFQLGLPVRICCSSQPWGQILGQNPYKNLHSLSSFYSQSHYSFAWDLYFYKLTQPLAVSVKEKGGKHDWKPYPLPYGLRNIYINLKSENSQDYAQKPQRECNVRMYVHEFGFCNQSWQPSALPWHIHDNMPVKGHFKEIAKQLYQYLLYSQIAQKSFTKSEIFLALHWALNYVNMWILILAFLWSLCGSWFSAVPLKMRISADCAQSHNPERMDLRGKKSNWNIMHKTGSWWTGPTKYTRDIFRYGHLKKFVRVCWITDVLYTKDMCFFSCGLPVL